MQATGSSLHTGSNEVQERGTNLDHKLTKRYIYKIHSSGGSNIHTLYQGLHMSRAVRCGLLVGGDLGSWAGSLF